MKRHAASRQNPVPNPASMPRSGTNRPDMPSFSEGAIFSAVIGTTISLKSLVCSTVAEDRIVEGLGNALCVIARGDRQENAIKVDMISRTVTTCYPDSQTAVLASRRISFRLF